MEKLSLISAIVPLYNEAGALPGLDRELKAALASLTTSRGEVVPYEIIYVNDGSTDDSLEVLKNLAGVTIVNLNRNYGQATALDAGFKHAAGEVIVSLDGDGQNDPADIPRLLAHMREGDYDVVAGWRKTRRDVRSVRILTRVGRAIRRALIADIVHDTGCTLRVYRAEAAKSLDIQGEMHRYILALLKWKGYRIGELVVNDRPREHGVSKYGPSKALRGFIDLVYIWFIYKYSQRPLHLFGYMSATSFIFGLAALAWSIYGKLASGLSLNRNGWFFLSSFFLLASIIFFSFGIVLDLLLQIRFNTSPNERRYYIREIFKS